MISVTDILDSMRPALALLVAMLALAALVAGCGSASTGSACSDLGGDLKGIDSYVKRGLERAQPGPNRETQYLGLTPSERRSEEALERQGKEAIAACIREGRATVPQQRPPP